MEFDEEFEIVKKRVIEKGEVLDVNELNQLFKSGVGIRTLTQRLKNKFGDDIGFWSPRHGKSFIFSERIPKGQIIEVGSNRLRNLNSSINEFPINEKLKEVAKALRSEIKGLQPIFPQASINFSTLWYRYHHI